MRDWVIGIGLILVMGAGLLVALLAIFGAVFLPHLGGGQWLFVALKGKQPWEDLAWLERTRDQAVQIIPAVTGQGFDGVPPIVFGLPPDSDLDPT